MKSSHIGEARCGQRTAIWHRSTRSCRLLTRLATVVSCIVLIFCTMGAARAKGLPLGRLHVPPGFKISVYARNVPGAREMALSPGGILYVGTGEETVYAIPDNDKDHKGDSVIPMLTGLNHPNGVEFKNGSLYVAEISKVLRYDNIDAQISKPPAPHLVTDKLPDNLHHGLKYIHFGPDGWLYVPVGAPCNVCEQPGKPPDWRFATILRLKEPDHALELFSSGVRNTVGFDWDPVSHHLWFTDNGRDFLGDDLPPEELNCAPKKGMHFGFPYCHGKNISDPDFGSKRKCSEFTPPELEIPAHHAALGMKFYTGTMFPAEYKNCIFICEHGSWNSSKKVGYQVSLVRFKNGKAASYETFIDGWNQGFTWGRPVDLLVMPDGSMLISDDHAGVIYRVTHDQ